MASEVETTMVSLNNAAVGLLHEGYLSPAAMHLKDALRAFTSRVAGDVEKLSSLSQQEHSIPILNVELGERLCSSDLIVSPNNAFRVYNSVFSFSETNAAPSQESREDRDSRSTLLVVLYNFGLLMHRRGIIEGKDVFLRKALQLYGMASDLVQGTPLEADGNLRLLQLALWTNQGHLCSHFLDDQGIYVCFQNAKYILLSSTSSSLNREDYVFFLSNVSFGHDGMKMAPSAAA
jgi:hypothetical protein